MVLTHWESRVTRDQAEAVAATFRYVLSQLLENVGTKIGSLLSNEGIEERSSPPASGGQ